MLNFSSWPKRLIFLAFLSLLMKLEWVVKDKKRSQYTVINDIMNDIVTFFNELWMTKGHKLTFWMTLWTTKRVWILWTTALLISQTAYLFKLSMKFNTRYLAGGACVRSVVESISFVWTHGARDLLQLTRVEHEQGLTNFVPQRPHRCHLCRCLHCCCCGCWHCHLFVLQIEQSVSIHFEQAWWWKWSIVNVYLLSSLIAHLQCYKNVIVKFSSACLHKSSKVFAFGDEENARKKNSSHTVRSPFVKSPGRSKFLKYKIMCWLIYSVMICFYLILDKCGMSSSN